MFILYDFFNKSKWDILTQWKKFCSLTQGVPKEVEQITTTNPDESQEKEEKKTIGQYPNKQWVVAITYGNQKKNTRFYLSTIIGM